jgi:signal transduction histidine kinase
VSNLVSNVEKYGADGKYLGITTRRSNTTTSIVVTDHGRGVPQVERDRIFDPFYRISNDLADGTSGAGIGLTISRELATLLSGRLTLIHTDSGAAFALEIPTTSEAGAPS